MTRLLGAGDLFEDPEKTLGHVDARVKNASNFVKRPS